MKVICTQENFKKGLGIVSHIAGKNVSLPILNNILIRAKDGLIVLISTNLDIGIKTVVRGKIEEDGELTVQARLLNDYVMLLDNSNLSLTKKNSDLLVQNKDQDTIIKGQETDDYPIVPEVDELNGFAVDNNILKDSLSQVVYCASYDDTRPELSGVLVVVSNNLIKLVATDSYRLAEKKVKIKENSDFAAGFSKIIPLKTLQEVVRIIEDEGETKIFFNDNQVVFKIGETVIISRLIEGNYPDYEQIIPESFKTRIEISRSELIKFIKTASLFSKTGINDVLIDFDKKGMVNISAANMVLGENKSTLKCEIKGENVKIIFNYKYLIEGLQNMNSKKIIFEIMSGDTPVILKAENEDDYLYLIMPIRQ